MYRALYRKYRPQTFADVVGQEAISTALQNQIIAGKVGHAYLFTGTRGTGKTTCAKIFAKAVNCENRNGANPCGECAPCKGLEDGSILDVIEIDAASNNGVDDIRDLRDETAYRPSRCNYKVYIIDEVHMLSTQAFNALLKIMEEPPSHVIFILATTEIHKVPATILSRCQRYDFLRIPAEKIAARLVQVAGEEGMALTTEAADLIARLADGALRDALSLLDTCAGTGGDVNEELVRRMAGVSDKGYLFQLGDAVQNGDTGEVLALVAALRERSIDVRRLSEELVHHYRNLMLAASAPDGSLLANLPAEERQRYVEAAKGVPSAFAIGAVRRLASAMDRMSRSPDPRIELELALFDLAAGPQDAPATAVRPTASAATVPKLATPSLTVAPQPASAVPVQASVAPPNVDSPGVQEAPPAEDAPPWEEEPVATPAPVAQEQEAGIAVANGAITDVAQAAPVVATPLEYEQAAKPMPPAAHSAPNVQQQPSEPPDGLTMFAEWPDVIAAMAPVDRMLYSYMKGSTAYLDGGARVLIDGGDMFLSYMREYADAGEKIKDCIEGVTGKRYAIGPYAAAKPKKQVTAQDTLKAWEEKGVPVTYSNEEE